MSDRKGYGPASSTMSGPRQCFQCQNTSVFACLACTEEVCRRCAKEHNWVDDDGKITCPQDRDE